MVSDAAAEVLAAARSRGWTIATAESCTGGLIAAALTDVAGSSDVFDRGFVTYSDAAKTAMLGVTEALLAAHGAVSAEVARAMAAGALLRAPVTLTVAVTGIAGPGGGSAAKPEGLVHFATALRGGPVMHRRVAFGAPGRHAVRQRTVETALAMLLDRLGS